MLILPKMPDTASVAGIGRAAVITADARKEGIIVGNTRL